MHQFNKNGIAASDDVVTATRSLSCVSKPYIFRRLNYPDICILNRSAAWALSCKQEDSVEIIQLKSAVDGYNCYLDRLELVPCCYFSNDE